MVLSEFKFNVSDNVVVWVHTVGSKRCFDFCYVLSECSNSVVLICCRGRRGDGTAKMRFCGGDFDGTF